ncbi:MAG TPA: exosortase B [Methyloradius sp.]
MQQIANRAVGDYLRSPWLLLIIGYLALYIPTFYDLSQKIWVDPEQAHGPLIFLLVLYLFWNKKQDLPNQDVPYPLLGWSIFIFGLLVYGLGRLASIFVFDVGSQVVVLAGLTLIVRGVRTLRVLWFPIFFIIFMIPLPGALLDVVTIPMKIAVSTVSEHILYWFDYPIARNGVVLQIGQYQLLVADACAGMHTLISLEALGLLYLQIKRHDSILRNTILAILIIPISFTANVIRVMSLVLVTYYFGNEAGQGFFHGFAGMLLFTVALTLIFGIDTIIQSLINKHALKSKS